MADKFIIKNKSGTLLSLIIEKTRLRMNQNDKIELCSITGMRVEDLERHPQIIKHLGYNNIEIIERYVDDIEDDITDLKKKMEKLIGLFSESKNILSLNDEQIEKIAEQIRFKSSDFPKEDKVVSKEEEFSEEEKLREELLRRQAEAFNPQKTNEGNFGKVSKDIEVDDFTKYLED